MKFLNLEQDEVLKCDGWLHQYQAWEWLYTDIWQGKGERNWNYATTSGNIGQLRNMKQLKAICNSSLKLSEKVEFSA